MYFENQLGLPNSQTTNSLLFGPSSPKPPPAAQPFNSTSFLTIIAVIAVSSSHAKWSHTALANVSSTKYKMTDGQNRRNKNRSEYLQRRSNCQLWFLSSWASPHTYVMTKYIFNLGRTHYLIPRISFASQSIHPHNIIWRVWPDQTICKRDHDQQCPLMAIHSLIDPRTLLVY